MDAANTFAQVQCYLICDGLRCSFCSTIRSISSGVSSDFKSLSLQYLAVINSSGYIVAESQDVTFKTWCNGLNRDWPFERVRCPIVMMFDDYTGLEFSPGTFDAQV